MSTRKSARVASKPAKKVVEPDEDDLSEEEEEVEEKPKKSPAPKAKKAAASKAKGKRKADEEEENGDGEEDEESPEPAKKAAKTGAAQDTSNAATTIAACLEAAKGSKTLRQVLTINPDSSSSTTTSTSTTVDPVDGSVVTTVTTLKELASEGYEPHFDKIADALVNHSVLFIGGLPHRVLELEFYCNGHKHVDLFAHGHERQKKRAEWYFHMTGKGYKGGSYKGLDVTFGEDEYYGGILLRTIQPLYGDFQPVEGPSLLVDRVLALNKCDTIEELVAKFDFSAELKDQSKTDHPLFFVYNDGDVSAFKNATVYKGARVGLSMKTFEDGKETYVGKFYRYMINPSLIKKGRNYFIASLHQQGFSAAEIATVTKSTPASVAKLTKVTAGGVSKNFKDYCFKKTLKNEEICEMLGACSVFAYPKK